MEYIDREKTLSTLENTAKYYEMPNADEWTKGIHYGLLHGVDNIVENVPVENVIQIPNEATNGSMIMTMFPKSEIIKQNETMLIVDIEGHGLRQPFWKDWWDAPYKKEVER